MTGELARSLGWWEWLAGGNGEEGALEIIYLVIGVGAVINRIDHIDT